MFIIRLCLKRRFSKTCNGFDRCSHLETKMSDLQVASIHSVVQTRLGLVFILKLAVKRLSRIRRGGTMAAAGLLSFKQNCFCVWQGLANEQIVTTAQTPKENATDRV